MKFEINQIVSLNFSLNYKVAQKKRRNHESLSVSPFLLSLQLLGRQLHKDTDMHTNSFVSSCYITHVASQRSPVISVDFTNTGQTKSVDRHCKEKEKRKWSEGK